MKYRIDVSSSGAHGGLYELEEETWFDVVEIATGERIMRFEKSYSASFGSGGLWEDGTYGGVKNVELLDDEYVSVQYYSGKEERIKIKES